MATPEEMAAAEAREADNARDPAGYGERTFRDGAGCSERGRAAVVGLCTLTPIDP
jgi:hypothetical protein